MRQVAQKPRRKFCGQKAVKKRKAHPIQPEKGETGCVLGAGEDGNGWKQVRTDGKTRSPNQNETHSHATHAKRKPAETQSFRRFCGRGRRTWSRLPPRVLLSSGERPAPTEAGAETGAAERHWRSLTPRHALRRAQPCLVAESLCALTKNREASIVLASLFLAGAEGLEPSARGFGVDVGECSRERGRGRFRPVLPDKSQKSGAGLVLRRNAPKLSEPKRGGQSAGRVYFL